jgi:hypothetical protein
MVLTLPKVRQDGKFIMTTIKAESITGAEPCEVFFNGKKHPGTKIYTIDQGFFKVLCEPKKLAAGWAHCLKERDAVMVDVLPSIGMLSPAKLKQLKA